ncbi:MAG: MinD/ParA family protein [Clostridiaceae bacterium]|nr:MinD/ParA family protein [Eubacteriales bacterium]
MEQAKNLKKMMQPPEDSAIRVITVTSAKGGVGKSSVAVNLAIALSRRGKRPLIVDTDFGLANIDVMLGVKPKYDLYNVIKDRTDIREAVVSGLYGVQFISGGSGIEELLTLGDHDLQRIIRNLMCLDDIADCILFDTGAGINENILRLICASHETLLVTTPEPTSFMDAYALVKIVGKRELKPSLRLVVNRAETEKEAEAAIDGFVRIAGKYTGMTIDPLGYILRDDNMVRAVKLQVPLLISYPNSRAAYNFDRLAANFLQSPVTDVPGMRGFIKRLFGKTGEGDA